jgi:hypothetical protein
VVLILVLVFSFSGGGDTPPEPVAQPQASAPAAADVDTQEYQGNDAVSVKVPAGWTRTAGGVYVDYIDPDNKLRKVRILVEKGSIAPAKFVSETAPAGLKKSKNCPSPFNSVATQEVEVAGNPGAELEYTCGSGANMRHGIWRMTTVNKKMYSFYLTTTDADFQESRKYFDAMAESFQLNL